MLVKLVGSAGSSMAIFNDGPAWLGDHRRGHGHTYLDGG